MKISGLKSPNRAANLLISPSRVEAPFIMVKIGGYTFGVYEGKTKAVNETGVVSAISEKYPNYVQSMTIKKINGTINQYSLVIKYPITENDDPNFFEKIFSSVSQTRKIEFTYGDFMLPEYIYKNEEAIITKVQTSFDIKTSVIIYTIDAVSASTLSLSGTYTFPAKTGVKPSDEIKKLLKSSKYHLTDVFTGMKDYNKIINNGYIADDDRKVDIQTKANISILDYLSYLVSYMSPVNNENTSAIKPNIYSLTTYDSENGPYFKVEKIQRSSNTLNQICTYEIDIGYPTANIVMDFSIKNNENWSIYYNYNRTLNNSDYLKRIDSKGEVEYIYSPQLTGTSFRMYENDSTWWTKVTQFPINASLRVKGLLRPSILMTYIKLNVWFYGHKHISSGYYIITAQTDSIGIGGYYTTLELVRVAEDEEFI